MLAELDVDLSKRSVLDFLGTARAELVLAAFDAFFATVLEVDFGLDFLGAAWEELAFTVVFWVNTAGALFFVSCTVDSRFESGWGLGYDIGLFVSLDESLDLADIGFGDLDFLPDFEDVPSLEKSMFFGRFDFFVSCCARWWSRRVGHGVFVSRIDEFLSICMKVAIQWKG